MGPAEHDVPFSISSKFMQIQYQGMSPMWFYLLKFLVSAYISWEICEGEAETSHAEPRRQAVRKNGYFTMIEDRSRVGLTKINSFSSFSDTNSGLSGPKYLRHQATLFPDPESLSAVWWIFVGELGLWWISDDICRDWGRKKAKEFAWMVGTSATVRRQILAAFTHVLQHTHTRTIYQVASWQCGCGWTNRGPVTHRYWSTLSWSHPILTGSNFDARPHEERTKATVGWSPRPFHRLCLAVPQFLQDSDEEVEEDEGGNLQVGSKIGCATQLLGSC